MKHMYRALFAFLVTFVSFHVKGQVSGPSSVCTGSTIALMATPAGGTWTSGMPAIAAINVTTGVTTGIAAGVAVITYTTPGPTYYFYTVTVNPVPAGIGGTATVCVGSTTNLTDATTGGTWSSTNVAVASVGSSTGVVSGNSAGTATISYIISSTGCYTTRVVTVNPTPAAITGTTTIPCSGTTTLMDATPGGVWSSSIPTAATISSSSGVVTAVSYGATIISYTLATGCQVQTTVTITGGTSPGTIFGSSSVCVGGVITLSTTGSGGTWSSVGGHTTITSGGVVTGVSAGLDSVFYTVSGSCGTAAAAYGVLVGASPTMGSIAGTLSTCVGSTTALSCTPVGGTWTSSSTAVASVTSTGGVVTGISAGLATISYTVTNVCGSGTATAIVTVNPAPGAITGGGSVCAGSSITLSSMAPGGSWSTASSAVSVGASTGIVTGISTGVATITYSAPGGCIATTIVTVNTTPSLTASATPASCGPMYTGIASGATTYAWSPSTGVTCSTCATTNLNVSTTTTYTVTGSNGTCSASATVTVNGDRINGHIFFSSTAPSTPACKVWLIQFNPTDSTITGVDSINSCMDGGAPYFEFAGKPAGSYMVKAKLLSSVAGTSDYIPTYGSSTPFWHLAASISHTSNTDVQNIMMGYGTVPSGPGFISGYVVSGAGKGTSTDAPVPGMIVYLRKASTGEIVTYTYTDASGAYSFTGLGYGNYIVYPEEFDYYTTASTTITLSASMPGAASTNFKKYTTSHTIAPITTAGILPLLSTELLIYPNPAEGDVIIRWGITTGNTGKVIIKDIAGREIMNTLVGIDPNTAESSINVSNIASGIYFITAKNGNDSRTEKLIIK